MGKNSRNDTSVAKGGKKTKEINNTDDLQSKSSGSGELDNAIDTNTQKGNKLVETKKKRDEEKTAKRKAAEARDAQKRQKDEEKVKRKEEKIRKKDSQKRRHEINHSSFTLVKEKIANADLSAHEMATFLQKLAPSERQRCCGKPDKENIFIYAITHGNKSKFLALIDAIEINYAYPCCVQGKTPKPYQSILDLLVEQGKIPVSDRKEMLEKLIEKIFKNETRTLANTCTKKQVLAPLHAALLQAQRSMEADAGAIYTMLSQIRSRTQRPSDHSSVGEKAGASSTNMPDLESAGTQGSMIEASIAIDDASRPTSSEIMTTSTLRMTPNLSGDEVDTESIGSASHLPKESRTDSRGVAECRLSPSESFVQEPVQFIDRGSCEISVLGAVDDDTELSRLEREFRALDEALKQIDDENRSLEEEVSLLTAHVCLCSQNNQGSTDSRRNSANSDSEHPNSFDAAAFYSTNYA